MPSHAIVLASVADRTGSGGTDIVRRAFERVESQLAARGWTVGRPVSVEVVRMPIMGATTSKPRGHTLYVSERARDGGMLEGLIAHEAGHMLLTEAGHPSHDPRVVRRIWTRLRLPDRGRQAFGQAYNHVQDIYADDIALLTDLGERAYAFFSD